MMKRIFSRASAVTGVVLAGALCFGTLPAQAVTAAPSTQAATPQADASIPSQQTIQHRQQITEIFESVNQHRANNGLKPLLFSVPASEEAQGWSKNMASQQKLYHNPKPGQDPRLKAQFYDRWAENVAARWDGDGGKMFEQWVNSPSHNSNMLDRNVNVIGIGMWVTGNKDFRTQPNNYYMWGTQNFYSYVGMLPALTYTHPDDYFEGRPSLDSQQKKAITVKNPGINYDAGTYTLPAVEGVEYYVNGVKKNVGTHSSNWEKVVIEYRPLDGWYHNTTNMKYSVTIDFTQYLQQVEVAVPEFNKSNGKYTINDSIGVNFLVNGVAKNPGTYDSGWTTINVKANAKPGYRIVGASSWSHTFTKPVTPTPTPPPTKPVTNVTPKAPSFQKDAYTYTIPATTGVQYKVNGANTNAGTYNGKGKKIAVTAVAKSGYRVTGATSWTYTFIDFSKAQDFRDTKGTAFAKEIRWLRSSGVTNGWANNTYQPYSTIKRDAMAAFLYRMAGSPAYTPPARSQFKDVATNNVFYKEISWLASTGITTGWADGTFRPNASVNRDTMAAFMYRFGSMCNINAVDNYKAPASQKFRDTPKNIAFYKEMSWMADAGISTGWSDNSYRPFTSVTREQMAAFLYRMDGFIAKNGGCRM